MRNYMRLLAVFFMSVNMFSFLSLAHAKSFESKYTLGPEDVIEINILRHPEFSGTYLVNLEGKIQYTIIGDMDVTGLDKEQLEEKIKRSISKYVVSPEVNVTIIEFKSKGIYVLGEVTKPGKYNMRSETITVKEAIMLAGLPTQSAALHRATILTAGTDSHTIKEVDLFALLYQADTKQDLVLSHGDTLYVPAALTETIEDNKGANNKTDSSKYTLGPDDVVDITVIKHPEFSGTYPVSLEGKIQYKFIGDLNVTGMTRGQLEERIKKVISTYVAFPEVSVTIKDFKSKMFYVLGEVKEPGKYNMRSENISVKEALMLSGLPTKSAALNKARIMSRDNTTRQVNLYSLLYSTDVKEDVLLSSGDTLYVPASVAQSHEDLKEHDGNFDDLKYTLGPDDVVDISVVDHPEFSGVYPVSLEGKVQYKFVGDMKVTGMTKGQLEEKIKKVISAYVSAPEVSVTITEFKSKAFYVLGEVGNPGKYFMRSDSITVTEAIMLAGLPTQAAAMRKTQVITPGLNGRTIRKLNLFSLLYEGKLKDNLVLKPGDYLYVPSTVIAKLIRVISPVSTTIGDIGGGRAGAAAIAGQ